MSRYPSHQLVLEAVPQQREQDVMDVRALIASSKDSELPLASAYLLVDEQEYTTTSAGLKDDDNDNKELPLARLVPDNNDGRHLVPRPEFLYVSAIVPPLNTKDDKETKNSTVLGLGLKQAKNVGRSGRCSGGVVISNIYNDGLLGKTGLLQVGDKVLAVNNVDCSMASLETVQRCILEAFAAATSSNKRQDGQPATTTISLCVHNPKGDARFVLSSVQKPCRDMKIGVFFLRWRGALLVTSVRDGSLFANSLLASGHRCYSINGEPCDNKGGQAAADMAASADRVTLISQARGDLATVLSTTPTKKKHLLLLGTRGRFWPFPKRIHHSR